MDVTNKHLIITIIISSIIFLGIFIAGFLYKTRYVRPFSVWRFWDRVIISFMAIPKPLLVALFFGGFSFLFIFFSFQPEDVIKVNFVNSDQTVEEKEFKDYFKSENGEIIRLSDNEKYYNYWIYNNSIDTIYVITQTYTNTGDYTYRSIDKIKPKDISNIKHEPDYWFREIPSVVFVRTSKNSKSTPSSASKTILTFDYLYQDE